MADLSTIDERQLLGITVPQELNKVAEAIERSRGILELEDDWDGQGSAAYAEVDWARACGFLLANALLLFEREGVAVPAPRITHGPDGSIDMLWRRPDRKLLMNFPAEASEPATYYGRTTSGREMKGSLDVSSPSL